MHYNIDNKKAILKRIFNKLSDYGDLVIMENLVDEHRSKDDCGLKISFMFAMMGYEGTAMSFNEYRELLLNVGFGDIQRVPRAHGVSDLIIARKMNEGKTSQ